MPIKVELDAYVIPDSHTVWKCSPGKTYRFYVAVKDAFTAFPDVRGLETIGGKPSDWTDQQILRVIAEDRRNREAAAVARGRKDAQIHEGVIKSDRAVLTFVKRIWFEAKLGDLIVIPAEGYDKEVLIGEILSDPGELRRGQGRRLRRRLLRPSRRMAPWHPEIRARRRPDQSPAHQSRCFPHGKDGSAGSL
jgi:hypothetical protein